MSELSRPAGFCETLSYIFHEQCYEDTTCVMRARISGPLTESVARQALFWCQNRYPMLHAQAESREDSSIEWHFDVDFASNNDLDAVPLEWLQRTDDAQINRVIDAELAKPRPDTRYLWRAVILSDGEHHDVAFVIPHYITDATSFITMFKQFMANCQHLNANDEAGIPKTTLPVPAPVDQLVKAASGGEGMMAAASDDEPWPWQEFAPKSDRESHNIWFSLDEETVARLVLRSKENGVSVNSALSAAYLRATEKVFFEGQEQRSLSISTAVSLRSYCQPPCDDEAFGWHISQVSCSQAVGPEVSFWQIASELGTQLKETLQQQADLGFFPAEFEPGPFAAGLQQMFEHDDEARVFGSPCMSNMGVVDMPQYDGLQVEDLCWTTKHVCGRNLASLYVLTMNGETSCCLAYTTPLLSDQMAQAIVDGIVRTVSSL